MSKSDKADIIKEHAINGRFPEIEEAYGAKAAMKGREYVREMSGDSRIRQSVTFEC